MRLVLAVLFLLMADQASACIRRSLAYTFADQVNAELDYLVCLHNEQNDLIRSLARDNQSLRDQLNKMELEIGNREVDVMKLRSDLNTLRSRFDITVQSDSPASGEKKAYVPFPAIPTK